MERINIKTPYVTTGQLLKLADFISNGGEAKFYLAEHDVFVDGEQDQRRGRKLYPGMTVKIEQREIIIVTGQD